MKNLLIGLLLLGGCVAIIDGAVSDESTTAASTTTAVANSTAPVRGPMAPELPVINSKSDSGSVKVAQSLLNTLGESVNVTGKWRTKTTQAVTNLRKSLKLADDDIIDAEVWKAAIEQVNRQASIGEFGKSVNRSLQKIQLPSGLLLIAVDELDKSAVEWKYAAPKGIEITDLAAQVFKLNPEKNIRGWKFCESEGKTTYAEMRRFWWALPKRMLSLVVESADGSNNVVITEEQSVSLEGCAGYKKTPTTEKKSSAGAAGESQSGSTSSRTCYVGMNLEDCEDLLGLAEGDRTDYVDCTGEGRMVMWASNWTIIGSHKGVAVISKSPYECA